MRLTLAYIKSRFKSSLHYHAISPSNYVSFLFPENEQITSSFTDC